MTNLKRYRTSFLKSCNLQMGTLEADLRKYGYRIHFSTTLSHKWRSEVDGIMIGKQTALLDNPTLNTRSWPGENPDKGNLGLEFGN
ncbi:MAG: hypothetical protein IPL23_30500 [Saprospiraceae bacterium]|nr:hypothetical protein [Saprospiraceae bacterium]